MRIIKNDVFLYLLIIFFAFLFFFRLGYNPLTNWDEAWYGSIAREIVRTNDWIRLTWNGYPYFDHPPLGFWLIALSYKIFGISEFSTRFSSAFLGLLSIILIYKTGLQIFNKKAIGFAAALVLGSSVWYVIRVRSGNLDSAFVFFYLLTIYFALRSSNNFKWFPLVGLSTGALIMTKTIVGLPIIVLIVFLNYPHFLKIRKNLIYIILAILLFSVIVFPWYIFHLKYYPGFYQRHFIEIGIRSKTLSSYFNLYINKPFYYLHMGIRKWYYVWLFTVIYLIIRFKFIKRQVFFLFLWNLIVFYPFLTSEKTELWHLIPVYLPISLIIAYGMYDFLSLLPYKSAFYAIFFAIIFLIQVKNFWPEIIPRSKYISDEIDISRKAAKYHKTIVLDEEFLPVAVFYSGRNIIQIVYYPNISNHTLVDLYQLKDKDLIVITRQSAVDSLTNANLAYKVLEKNNSFLILKK